MWIICVISVLCLLCFRARLFIDALWSPAGKGLTSWLSFVMSNCVFVTFPCGILGQVWYLIVSIPGNCVFSYVSTEDNKDIVNIKATTCNCIVVTHLTKLAISIFLDKIEGTL